MFTATCSFTTKLIFTWSGFWMLSERGKFYHSLRCNAKIMHCPSETIAILLIQTNWARLMIDMRTWKIKTVNKWSIHGVNCLSKIFNYKFFTFFLYSTTNSIIKPKKRNRISCRRKVKKKKISIILRLFWLHSLIVSDRHIHANLHPKRFVESVSFFHCHFVVKIFKTFDFIVIYFRCGKSKTKNVRKQKSKILFRIHDCDPVYPLIRAST